MSTKQQLDAVLERMNWLEERGLLSETAFQFLLSELLPILIQEVSNLSDSLSCTLSCIDKQGIRIAIAKDHSTM